jgi:hypothetical protein
VALLGLGKKVTELSRAYAAAERAMAHPAGRGRPAWVRRAPGEYSLDLPAGYEGPIPALPDYHEVARVAAGVLGGLTTDPRSRQGPPFTHEITGAWGPTMFRLEPTDATDRLEEALYRAAEGYLPPLWAAPRARRTVAQLGAWLWARAWALEGRAMAWLVAAIDPDDIRGGM